MAVEGFSHSQLDTDARRRPSEPGAHHPVSRRRGWGGGQPVPVVPSRTERPTDLRHRCRHPAEARSIGRAPGW